MISLPNFPSICPLLICELILPTNFYNRFLTNFFKTYYFFNLEKENYVLSRADMNNICFIYKTMPEAIECFLESESYEGCLRNVMYIGGDTDTLCAIAGAIAEAYWGIPEALIKKTDKYIPEDMKAVIKRFYKEAKGR